MRRTEVSGEPHQPQGKGIDSGLRGPLVRGPCPFRQTFEYEVFDVVGKAGGSQLALVLSVVLGHHDEGHPEVVEDGRRVYVGSPDTFQDAAIPNELVGQVRGVQSGGAEATEGSGGVEPRFEDACVKVVCREGVADGST